MPGDFVLTRQGRVILTDREKWLMTKAWAEGYAEGGAPSKHITATDALAEWLDESVSDAGHTVEMMLAHSAPVLSKQETK